MFSVGYAKRGLCCIIGSPLFQVEECGHNEIRLPSYLFDTASGIVIDVVRGKCLYRRSLRD